LLIANLARLIPDSVLHNIMPIFTFMGASDLQRDDAYSFKVVENVSHFAEWVHLSLTFSETMEQIVPIMAQSLKQSASSPLELFQGA
jgi:U3 small nucleolar RNA-associated protein 10